MKISLYKNSGFTRGRFILFRFVALLVLSNSILCSCIGTDVLEQVTVEPILRITSQVVSIQQGSQFKFEYIYFNQYSEKEPAPVQWHSSNINILEIDSAGLASAISQGSASIITTYNNLSDTVDVVVTMEAIKDTTSSRTGSFTGLNNYAVSGGVSMEYDASNNLVVVFGSDFNSDSGPGLYVYLSNSNNSVAGGHSLGPLKSNTGVQTYPVSGSVSLNTYNYVLIHCQPFNVPFGWAELK